MVMPLKVGTRPDSPPQLEGHEPFANSRTERPSGIDRVVVGWPTLSRRDDAEGGARLGLWWAPLDLPTSIMEDLAGCVLPAERQHAERFNHPRERRRFIAARGWLRHLLARELACAPSDVPIIADGRGKPRIACSDLSFSASRTSDVALYAVSWSMEVGVDVEAIRWAAEIDGIIARFMSPAERRALNSMAPAQRQIAFFDCWTRKEAYGKAIGTGLSFGLREIDLWREGSAPVTVPGWSVHQVYVAPGFAGAVAGADTNDWIAPIPRRIRATGLIVHTDPPPGHSRSALVASRG
jgi:4'-phosphopantetheinyl transferase